MLIQFIASNYRSVGEEQILSLVPASKQKEFPNNIIANGKYEALNALAIYGANSSGKSNLLKGMRILDELLHLSQGRSSTTKLPYNPFLLREGWDKKPTKFEITFITNQNRYRYGLEFLPDKIVTEWLYRKSQSREVYLFLREGDVIDASSGFKGSRRSINAAIDITRSNSLFLSACDSSNIEEAKTIFQWFSNFNVMDGLSTEKEELQTVSMWDDDAYKQRIIEYLIRLDIGITGIDISTKDFEPSDLPNILNEEMKKSLIERLSGKKSYKVNAKHPIYSSAGLATQKLRSWTLEEGESAGTNKVFHLSGPILWALVNGGVLIIDEIEAKLHPKITLDIMNTFLNKETNPNNAQIIFATHDTNLLSYSKLRRDQIYFVEKNKWESTEIYSLSDFKYLSKTGSNGFEKERPDTDKEKRYFEGRYGAIPIISNFKPLK